VQGVGWRVWGGRVGGCEVWGDRLAGAVWPRSPPRFEGVSVSGTLAPDVLSLEPLTALAPFALAPDRLWL